MLFALTPSQVFYKAKDSILVVHSLDPQGNVIMQGSGVILPSKQIATNCHILDKGDIIKIGKEGHFVQASIDASDKINDVCLLSSKDFKGKSVILGNSDALKVGEPVYAIGAPRGLELSLSDGIISQLRGNFPPIIQTTAAISPGSSGGGLFDNQGRLIGLTTSQKRDSQNINFAVPVEHITKLKLNSPFRTPDIVLDAIKYSECPLGDNGKCNPYSIKINNFDDIQKAKQFGHNIDINLLNCYSLENCNLEANRLIKIGIKDINLGAYQINYQDHPILDLKQYFTEMSSREFLNKFLIKLVKQYGYSWETLGRYRFSAETNPNQNEEYYIELYDFVYGISNDIDENISQDKKNYEPSMRQIRQSIQEHTVYPKMALRLGQEGEVIVKFILTKNGIIDKLRIKKSSTHDLLDIEALSIIKSSSQYFPKPSEDIKITIPITFELKKRPIEK